MPRSTRASEKSVSRFKGIDVALLALLLALATLQIADSGFVSGQELWPMPDAVEYAAR